ncbi:MAG: biotin--[acetyl-CoA-carboxylase] ligase [Actinomycetota bacterium]
MLSDHALTRALEGAGLSAPVRFEEVTPSTQVTAARLAADGAPEYTLVAAAHQTQGRGRLGRSWFDDPGRALMFSVVLRPGLPPARGGLLSLLAGVALVLACDRVAGGRAACKWPNDVLVDGRKAAGIIAESLVAEGRLEHVVLGVGVNLGAPPASMPGAGAVDAGDEELLTAFLGEFAGRYDPAARGFPAAVVGEYRPRCATLGTRVRATSTDGEVVEGEAVGLGEEGQLLVRVADHTVEVGFGRVEHLE